MDHLSWRGNTLWRKLQSAQGSTLIELALVMPVFFLLVFGFINFSLIGLDICSTSYAARTAIRYISLHSTNTYGYTSDAAAGAVAQNILNQFAVPYPTSARTVSYVYCGTLTNATGYTYNCIKIIIHVTYTIVLPGYTYSGLNFLTSTESVMIAPQ